MTVIAYRGGVIAADTRLIIGYATHEGAVKIARSSDGSLAGVAGSCSEGSAFLDWFMTNRETSMPKPAPKDDGAGSSFVAMMINPLGDIAYLNCGGLSPIAAPYFALGSGAEVALGAMHAGADALGAVSAAIEHAYGCGGHVVSERISRRSGGKV